MLTIHNPTGVAKPSSAYAHGVKAEGAKTWLHVSGQVGTNPDGTLECAWRRGVRPDPKPVPAARR
jgi:enamine deaminase RidA (YjgF/YER057c/UK114 family)